MEAESHAGRYWFNFYVLIFFIQNCWLHVLILSIAMIQSQKNMKETIWRAKRLTREMQSYWKRYDRVERETRRRLEKEAEEQRKMDVELIEVRRYLVTILFLF